MSNALNAIRVTPAYANPAGRNRAVAAPHNLVAAQHNAPRNSIPTVISHIPANTSTGMVRPWGMSMIEK